MGHRQWALDFISFTHGVNPGGCKRIALISIESHPLAPFTIVEAPSGKRTTFRPMKYYESWIVRACDELVEWRIVDDPADKRYQEVTPLLWQRGLTPRSS
jgi:hypothetical protein